MHQITPAAKKLSDTVNLQDCNCKPGALTSNFRYAKLHCNHPDVTDAAACNAIPQMYTKSDVAAQLRPALAISLVYQIPDTHPQGCTDLQCLVKCSGCFWSCLLAIKTTCCTSPVDQAVHTGFPVLL